MQLQNLIFVTTLICLLFLIQPISSKQNIDIIDETISQAQKNIWARYKDNHWNYPTYLGTMFTSVYWIELQAMGWQDKTQFDPEVHKQIILKQQLPSGAWQQMPSENEGNENLDATIQHYWFLKTIGYDLNSEVMTKAKKWILSQGGIEAAQQMTRFKMSMFGKYDWSDLIYVPMFIFDKNHFLSYFSYAKDIVAQWVYPHLTGIAYMRYFRLYIDKGADIFELFAYPPQNNKLNLTMRETGEQPEDIIVILIKEMISLVRPKGSIGTYTVSTYFNIFCMKHFIENWPTHPLVPELKIITENAFKFIEMNIFNEVTPYIGQLDDGRWWDTLLQIWALQESGEDKSKLDDAIQKLGTESLQPNGGIAYGWEFEYVPDADDTSVFITVLGKQKNPRFQEYTNRSINFLKNFQNTDGGYAAFTQNLQGNWLYLQAFKFAKITGSAEIFDPSAVDIVGHFLEGCSEQGIGMDDPSVKKAIAFIEDRYVEFENNFVAWEARWGINFIYSAGAIIPGLKRIGYDMKKDMIKRNIAWLVDKQNKDGGFGENILSYNDPVKYNGRGVSTPTQTSWALLALIDIAEYYDVQSNIDKAISYLLKEFWEVNQGNWEDRTVVGTGHRKVIYLHYPAYCQAFPLIALGRYRDLINNKTIQKLNIDIELENKVINVLNKHHDL